MSDENTDVANADLAKTELAKRIRLLTAAVGNNLGRVQDGVFSLVTENETDYFLDQRMKEFEANMKALHAYTLELAKVRGYQSEEAAAKIALRNEGYNKGASKRAASTRRARMLAEREGDEARALRGRIEEARNEQA